MENEGARWLSVKMQQDGWVRGIFIQMYKKQYAQVWMGVLWFFFLFFFIFIFFICGGFLIFNKLKHGAYFVNFLKSKHVIPFFFFYWSITALQCWVSFCCTTKWISYTFTRIPSLLRLPLTQSPIPCLKITSEHRADLHIHLFLFQIVFHFVFVGSWMGPLKP